jgi:hypothetical protein
MCYFLKRCRCSIPHNNGLYYEENHKWRKSFWDKYYTNAPEQQRKPVEICKYSEESLIKLSVRYGVNPKTIHKWKKRDFTHDAKMGP